MHYSLQYSLSLRLNIQKQLSENVSESNTPADVNFATIVRTQGHRWEIFEKAVSAILHHRKEVTQSNVCMNSDPRLVEDKILLRANT